MFLTGCLAVIFGLELLVISQLYRVPNDRLCVRCTNRRIKMSYRAIKNVLASLLSFTRNADIKICAFIRLMYIRGFAGVNNHDVALYVN